jgi:YVTN family beta-propeller protein
MIRNRRLSRWLLSRAGLLTLLVMTTLSSLLLSGCAALPSMIKPALETEGEVFVYLQPFAQEAQRLRFTVDRLFAVRSDGAEFPLPLALEEFSRGTAQRQRLLASGRVPPGRYVGLSWTIKKAVLTGDQGEATLLAPEGPVKTDFSFEVQQKQAMVLALSLLYAESVQSGFRFSPVFSLSVPSRPLSGLTGYVTNRNDDTIMVFNKKSGEVAAVITTGRGPRAIALDQKAGRAYVSLSGEDAVDVLDVTAGSIINRIHLNIGDGPREISLTPDGKKLLVVNASSRTVSIIDPRALLELGRVPVGEGARSVLVDHDGKRAYVFNELSNTITVIDIANRATVVTLSTDTGPMMGQFNRKGDKLYVIFAGSPYLSVINPFTVAIDRKIFVGPGLSSIKVDTTTDMLYACRKQDAVVEVYDPFSLTPGAYIQAIIDVAYMTIDGDENTLYLVSPETKMLMTVNLISKKITAMIDAGEDPAWVTMMGER